MNHTERVLHDFGKQAQDYPWDAIYDVACLPHPKEEIRDALFSAILAKEMTKEDDSTVKNALSTLLTSCLPRYQEGVGKEPLYSVGYDLQGDLLKPDFARTFLQEESAEVKRKRRANAERYKQMNVLAERESAQFFELLENLPSNSPNRARYEEMAELLRSHDHSAEKWLNFLPAERRVVFDKAFGKSRFDIDDEDEGEEGEISSLKNN